MLTSNKISCFLLFPRHFLCYQGQKSPFELQFKFVICKIILNTNSLDMSTLLFFGKELILYLALKFWTSLLKNLHKTNKMQFSLCNLHLKELKHCG